MADGTLYRNARCIGCGYQLTGSTGNTCPECGRWFDPDDTTTYRTPLGVPTWRKLAKPPSIAECLFIAAFSAYGLIHASNAAGWESQNACCASLLLAPIWFAVVVLWIGRARAVRRDGPRAKQDAVALYRPARWRWLILPVCVLLVVSSWIYPWPLILRFSLSRSAFESALAAYQVGAFTGGQVGLYHVTGVYTPNPNRPKSVWFQTGSSIFDPVGFEYDSNPGHVITDVSIQVAPNWYTYED
jgi:hypothetical protein